MIMKYTQTKFQEFLLIMKRDIHVKKKLVKIKICNSLHCHTKVHGINSILFISIDRVFNWLFYRI